MCRISDLPDLLTKKAYMYIIRADTRRTVPVFRANWKFAKKEQRPGNLNTQ